MSDKPTRPGAHDGNSHIGSSGSHDRVGRTANTPRTPWLRNPEVDSQYHGSPGPESRANWLGRACKELSPQACAGYR